MCVLEKCMAEKVSIINDLTEGSVFKKLIRFSLPFVLANLLQTLYVFADMIVVGQFVGSAGITAVSVGGQIITIFTNVGIGFASGAQILISQQVGAKDRDNLKYSIGTMFTMACILAVVFTALGCCCSEWLLRLVNLPEESMKQGIEYVVICSIGMIFIYGYNSICAVLRGMGESKLPLVFVAIATVVNVVFDLLFVGVFKMEVYGAALATVLGQTIAFISATVYLVKNKHRVEFDFKLKSFKIHKTSCIRLVKLGMPLILHSVAINGTVLFVTAYINDYGLVASTVNSIGSKLYNIMSIVIMSLQSASASMIGQNMGAGKIDRIKKICYIGWGISFSFFLIVCVVFMLIPETIFSIFDQDPQVLAMARTYVEIALPGYIAFAGMNPPLALIQGIGNVNLDFIIAILDGVVARVFLSLFLGSIWGLNGYFWGNSLAGYVSVIIGVPYFFWGKWEKRKTVMEM